MSLLSIFSQSLLHNEAVMFYDVVLNKLVFYAVNSQNIAVVIVHVTSCQVHKYAVFVFNQRCDLCHLSK